MLNEQGRGVRKVHVLDFLNLLRTYGLIIDMNSCSIVPDIVVRICFILCTFSINYTFTQVIPVFGCHLVCNDESNF